MKLPIEDQLAKLKLYKKHVRKHMRNIEANSVYHQSRVSILREENGYLRGLIERQRLQISKNAPSTEQLAVSGVIIFITIIFTYIAGMIHG